VHADFQADGAQAAASLPSNHAAVDGDADVATAIQYARRRGNFHGRPRRGQVQTRKHPAERRRIQAWVLLTHWKIAVDELNAL